MNRITKNYIYNLIYQVFILIVPLVTAPYLARTLGASNQGIASYVASIASIISTITLLGIYNYGNREIAYKRDNKSKMSQIFWEIMFLRFLLGVIGTFLYFIIIFNLKKYQLFFILYYPWLLASYCDCTWIYVGLEDMKPAVMKNIFTKILTILGIFIFVKDMTDINIYIIILGCSVLISNILSYGHLKNYIEKPIIDLNNLGAHLKNSFILFLPSVAMLIYMQVDKIMIEIFTDETSQVAFYDNSDKIVSIPLAFITVLSTVMMPRIANEFNKGNTENINRYILTVAEISMFIAFPMMWGLIVISSKFVPWYLGQEYLPIILGIIFISPIVVSNSLEGISGKQYFIATNQTNILIKSYSITALLNIIANILLIPKYGFLGASLATLISSYVAVIIQFYYLQKQINISSLLSIAFKYLGMSTLMGLIVYFSTYTMAETPLTTITQVIMGIISYMILGAIFKDKFFLLIFSTMKNFINKK